MLCNLLSLFISLNSCGAGEPAPEPTRTPEPTRAPLVSVRHNADEPSNDEKASKSTDGISMWEWKWERMSGLKFVREPMTDEEIEEHFPEEDRAGGDLEGRFIFIPNRP